MEAVEYALLSSSIQPPPMEAVEPELQRCRLHDLPELSERAHEDRRWRRWISQGTKNNTDVDPEIRTPPPMKMMMVLNTVKKKKKMETTDKDGSWGVGGGLAKEEEDGSEVLVVSQLGEYVSGFIY